jgi:predicted kinase
MLTLIRGCAGSGKSTLAKNEYIPKGYIHLEADMYFHKNGEYVFDFRKLGDAHKWCMLMAEEHLKKNHKVIVTNTFTKHWECYPYIGMAHILKKELEVIHLTTRYTNVHGVPEDKVQKMIDGYESFNFERNIP